MHEREIKSRRYSLVCLIASIVIFLIGAAAMIYYFVNADNPISALAFPFFFIPYSFCYILSVILSAISLKLASIAVRECMHNALCCSSKALKIVSSTTLIIISAVGILLMLGEKL